MTVSEFIFSYEGNQKEILLYFHDLFTQELKLGSKIRYRIPFYDGESWICYINPKRGGAVELCFLKGKELSNKSGLLQSKDRKQIAGISFYKLDDIPFEALLETLHEAIALDKKEPYRFFGKST